MFYVYFPYHYQTNVENLNCNKEKKRKITLVIYWNVFFNHSKRNNHYKNDKNVDNQTKKDQKAAFYFGDEDK